MRVWEPAGGATGCCAAGSGTVTTCRVLRAAPGGRQHPLNTQSFFRKSHMMGPWQITTPHRRKPTTVLALLKPNLI